MPGPRLPALATTTENLEPAPASLFSSPRAINGARDSRERVNPRRSVLPPLPSRSPVNRSSSPRYHVSASSSSSRPAGTNHHPPHPFTPPPQPVRFSIDWQGNTNILDNPAPNQWGQDSVLDHISLLDTSGADDPYLYLLADNDWSSPSGYPSLPPPPDLSGSWPLNQPAFHAQLSSQRRAPYQHNVPRSRVTTPTHVTSQIVASTPSSAQSTLPGTEVSPQASRSTIYDAMPSSSRRQALVADPSLPSKRQKTSRPARGSRTHTQTASSVPAKKSEQGVTRSSDDDLFGSDDEETSRQWTHVTGEPAAIDLTEASGVPEELKRPDVDNRIKVSAFQCVICMDNVTSLTVTHCGHLYCAQCLHQSLHVDATRGKCPMCRSKIDMKKREAYTQKTKGFWPLELQLMKGTRKGKRKADDVL